MERTGGLYQIKPDKEDLKPQQFQIPKGKQKNR